MGLIMFGFCKCFHMHKIFNNLHPSPFLVLAKLHLLYVLYMAQWFAILYHWVKKFVCLFLLKKEDLNITNILYEYFKFGGGFFPSCCSRFSSCLEATFYHNGKCWNKSYSIWPRKLLLQACSNTATLSSCRWK